MSDGVWYRRHSDGVVGAILKDQVTSLNYVTAQCGRMLSVTRLVRSLWHH